MKIRYEAKEKYKFGDLMPGVIFYMDGHWYIKTDSGMAVNIESGTEIGMDDSYKVGVPDNAELVIVGG